MGYCRKAFTLAELLVILAIILVLAGTLFPVFVSAKQQAQATQCISRFREVSRSVALYSDDYDQLLVPINHQLSRPGTSENDRTWVQVLFPYRPSFEQFFCPENRIGRTQVQATFDQDLVAGDTSSQFYTASQKVNLGYNFQYLAPVVRTRSDWIAVPRSTASVASVSSTLLFVDSAQVDEASGKPVGGSWLVVPPCRFEQGPAGRAVDTFTGLNGIAEIFTPTVGWNSDTGAEEFPYGGAWTWHRDRLTVAMLDGSARSSTPQSLSQGCDPQPNWQGFVQDNQLYVWDLN